MRAVGQYGTFTAAADSLGYTQPAISQMVRRLERRTGTALVDRVGRGVRLTEAGRVLAHHATGVLLALEAAEREVAAIAGLQGGVVRLNAFPSSSATLVPQSLALLRRRHPALGVQFVEAEPPESLRALLDGRCDIVVAFDYSSTPSRSGAAATSLSESEAATERHGVGDPATGRLGLNDLPGSQIGVRGQGAEPDASGLVSATLLRDQIQVALRADDPIAAGPAVRLSRLRERTWIAGCPQCRQHLVQMCQRAGFEPDVAYETDDYVAVLGLVAAGLGVAVVPDLALRSSIHPEVATLPIRPISRRRVYVATTPDLIRVPAVRATFDALRDSARTLTDQGAGRIGVN